MTQPFHNIYFLASWHGKPFTAFRDHNFITRPMTSDDPFEAVSEETIRHQIGRVLLGSENWIDPFYETLVDATLSSGASKAFVRAHPDLPIDERDYSLSKLFQFFYLPLTIRFIRDHHYYIRIRLDEILESLSVAELRNIVEKATLGQMDGWSYWFSEPWSRRTRNWRSSSTGCAVTS